MKRLVVAAVVAVLASCAGKPPPPTRYYQLALPLAEPAVDGQGTLVIEPLATTGAYDDERMVYRVDPYRLDYYDYHRWTAAPGALVSGYLEQALRRTGRFRTVASESTAPGAVTLGGRVVALEEVDTSKTRWVGHVVLELVARDASGNIVWTRDFDENEPMPTQSPEGLARAVTAAMARVANRVAPELGSLCDRQALSAGSRAPLARAAQ